MVMSRAMNASIEDPDVKAAVAASHFRELPPPVVDAIFRDAYRTKVPAGRVIHRQREGTAYLDLVITGVIRVFVTAPDGRTMTIRYCRPGELLGAMSLFSNEFSEPATKQALVDAEVLRISPAKVRDLAGQDIRVARALLIELSERARNFVYEIPGSAFATVRQRVARQLLDLAAVQPDEHPLDEELSVKITQHELAAAAGTVREVAVRALRELRLAGAVRTERDRIVIVDAARLTEAMEWNTSS